MVFQALALFPHLNIADNIAYSLKLRGMDTKRRAERVAQLLDLVALPGIGERRVDQLSGGQRQRVAIARALAQEPMLFLMDEPLSALDAKLRDHMQIELRQLQQRLKITTILVTHDQREAMTIADTIVIMANGKVQQVGSPVEIYRRPANRFVTNFIGQSTLLPISPVGEGRVKFGPLDIAVDTDDSLHGGSVLCVRPEDVVLSRPTGASCELIGQVSFVRDVGSSVDISLDCLGETVFATVSPTLWQALSQEPKLAIQFAPNAACLLANE
jgi:putative spermidine/putrescine transport system ATP-binding protein